VNRSPHVDKRGREQFRDPELTGGSRHLRAHSQTVDALMKLDLPAEWTWKIKAFARSTPK